MAMGRGELGNAVGASQLSPAVWDGLGAGLKRQFGTSMKYATGKHGAIMTFNYKKMLFILRCKRRRAHHCTPTSKRDGGSDAPIQKTKAKRTGR